MSKRAISETVEHASWHAIYQGGVHGKVCHYSTIDIDAYKDETVTWHGIVLDNRRQPGQMSTTR
jgi:hypothetical protein